MLGYPPGSRHPPGRRHPLRADTPQGADTPLGANTPPPLGADPAGADTPLSRPPTTEHAGRYGQRAGGTHPTGMQSCLILLIFLNKINERFRILHFV